MVREKLPRLEATWNIPDTLCEGEVRCCELELSNVGPVDMSRVHLISGTPGLVSFGVQRQNDNESLFEHPLLEDPVFRVRREDGVVEQTSLDMMSVPLESGVLRSGVNVKIPLWIRGPSAGHDHHLLLYYDTAVEPGRHSARMLPAVVRVSCETSLEVSCTRSQHISHNNTSGNLIKISVRNVSKDLSINMETISLTQVSLVSRDQSLHSVETSGSGVTVSRGHSSSIIVSTAQVDSVPEKWRDVPGLVTLPANVIIPGGR